MGCAISFQHLSPFKGAEHVGISVLMLQRWHSSLPVWISAETMPANSLSSITAAGTFSGTFSQKVKPQLLRGSAITYCTLIIHKIKHKHEEILTLVSKVKATKIETHRNCILNRREKKHKIGSTILTCIKRFKSHTHIRNCLATSERVATFYMH